MDIGLFILFIILWFTIYGGLHYYTYRKIIPFSPTRKKVLVVALFLLASSLFIVELLTHNDFAGIAYPLAVIAYSWMGIIFLFFFISGAFDLIEQVIKRTGPRKLDNAIRSKQRTLWVGSVVVLLSVSGYMSAQKIHVETLHLQSNKITQPLRIVQISDLHLGILSNESLIDSLIEVINSLDADIIVSTGDLVDMQLDHIKDLAEQLSAMKSKLGKYAVYGNHEVFAGLDHSNKVIDTAGFTLLSNASVSPNELITIIGVDDPAVTGSFQNDEMNEVEILEKISNHLFTILLKHQPRLNERSTEYFDLQLSGHTHGGQIFPFGLLTKLIYPIGFGLKLVADDTWIYVSRGTGTWGPPMRILARTEVTLFEINSEK